MHLPCAAFRAAGHILHYAPGFPQRAINEQQQTPLCNLFTCPQKRPEVPKNLGSPVCFTAADRANSSISTRAAEAAACIAGVSPAIAAYRSSHLQSKRSTDHLHF